MMNNVFLLPFWLCALLLMPNSFAEAPLGYGAVATAHPDATAAGKQILLNGGNAFDAAVAISASLAVVEPYGSGIGGGGFWLLHDANSGQQVMIDGRETAPARAHARMYLDRNGEHQAEKSLNGPLAAGIPGTVAALDYLSRHYGELPLAKTLAPAIEQAENGFLVTERYQKLMGFRHQVMNQYPEAAAIFLRDGEVPKIGDRIVQSDLAATLSQIAKRGKEAFYRGPIAEQMVKAVNRNGGIWQTADLATYRIKLRKPVISNYRDMKIISAPPPSSGGIVLAQALGILEQFTLLGLPQVERIHLVSEAMRRAYRDRAAYLGDGDFVEIPMQRLLDKDYLHGLAITITPKQATPISDLGLIEFQQTGSDTTHFSVMDKHGNRVAATLSINLPFGSAYVAGNTGVLLNDEMDDFSSKPLAPNAYGLIGNEANQIEPGKRPLSSMSPTFIETEDKIGILGTPGGSRIISMVLLGILDFEQRRLPKSWVSVPRYHHQFYPDEIQYELGALSQFEAQQLKSYGHQLKERNRQYGNMQAILFHRPTQSMLAASDPRGEGEAVVFRY